MSRDQLLGRACRAVLVVAGTAGGLGGRAVRRWAADKPTPTGRAATPGLPPRIGREREPGMPPVQPEHGPAPGLPPRIERDRPGLPPRIDRTAEAALPPRIEARPDPAPAHPPVTAAPQPEPPPRIEPRPDPAPAHPPVTAASQPELPPRIEPRPDPAPAHPPVSPAPQPELPPRIERAPAPQPELPPRIEPRPDPAPAPAHPPVAAEASDPAVVVTDSPQPAYRPIHARDEPAAPAPVAAPEPEPEPKPEPAPQPAPVAPIRPDPLASPVRNVLRSHQRLASILAALIVVAAAGYWVLRVHQRIGEGALEAGVTKQQRAPTVKCAALQSNGAVWACAVVYQAESVCLIANVDPLGSWSTKVGNHRCERVPQLAGLAPKTVTATMVAADIDRRQGNSDFVCGKLPSHKVRWACERPLATGGQCLVVRVIEWTSWNVLDGGRTCAHDPGLQKALKRASSTA